MHTHTHVHTGSHTDAHTHAHRPTPTHPHQHSQTHMHTRRHTHTCTQAHMHTSTHVHTQMHTLTPTHAHQHSHRLTYTHTQTHRHTQTHTHTHPSCGHQSLARPPCPPPHPSLGGACQHPHAQVRTLRLGEARPRAPGTGGWGPACTRTCAHTHQDRVHTRRLEPADGHRQEAGRGLPEGGASRGRDSGAAPAAWRSHPRRGPRRPLRPRSPAHWPVPSSDGSAHRPPRAAARPADPAQPGRPSPRALPTQGPGPAGPTRSRHLPRHLLASPPCGQPVRCQPRACVPTAPEATRSLSHGSCRAGPAGMAAHHGAAPRRARAGPGGLQPTRSWTRLWWHTGPPSQGTALPQVMLPKPCPRWGALLAGLTPQGGGREEGAWRAPC